MGHGPFLPLISLYVVFLRRRAIAAAIGKPDARGLAFVLAGVAIFWIGLKTEDVRICLTALVLWTWAVPFAVWGAGVARQLVFPAGYLLLCVPIDSLVIFFTMKLRLLAAIVAVGIANGIGIATVRIGTGLHSTAGAGFNLDVADSCSGLRSIFAMAALSAAYAFFSQKTLWRQWLLFACSVPVAVIGNVTRIVAITIVAAVFGEKTATGFYHDYSGYIVFLVAILLLMEMGRLIGRLSLPARWSSFLPKPRPDPTPTHDATPFRLRDLIRLACPPLLLLGCVLMVRFEPAIRTGDLSFLADALPSEVGSWHGSPLWHCHNEQCMRVFTEAELQEKEVSPLPEEAANMGALERWPPLRDLCPRYRCPACDTGELFAASLGEQQLLPDDTRILRSRYSGVGSDVYTVTLVISGPGRNSLHRPELCLPAQGFVMNRIRTVEIPDVGATVKSVELERTQAGAGNVSRLAFVYWFFSADRQTASHVSRVFWTAWDRAIHHRATRWVMVTITADQKAARESRSDQMLKFSGELMQGL
jgi:exosortase